MQCALWLETAPLRVVDLVAALDASPDSERQKVPPPPFCMLLAALAPKPPQDLLGKYWRSGSGAQPVISTATQCHGAQPSPPIPD